MRLLAVWLINAMALLALPWLLPSIHVASFATALGVALVLGLISLAGYSLVKRANLPIPPHVELVRSIAGPNLS